ncbi:transposable element Tcb2 transposase [Trichonephila clavipes]|nr:transposable element Tcb2 transposase [Trichonephila clavipes]
MDGGQKTSDRANREGQLAMTVRVIVFHQDTCVSHNSCLATGWLDEHSSDFSIINWPPRSSDSNHTEHLWDVLEQGVKENKTFPVNLDWLFKRHRRISQPDPSSQQEIANKHSLDKWSIEKRSNYSQTNWKSISIAEISGKNLSKYRSESQTTFSLRGGTNRSSRIVTGGKIRAAKRLLRKSHTCSMGLRSGDRAVQSIHIQYPHSLRAVRQLLCDDMVHCRP